MKTIALVETANDGHRTAYMRSFTAALLLQNCYVVCLIPDTDPIKNWIDVNYPQLKNNVSYFNYSFRWEPFRIPYFISIRILSLYNFTLAKKIIRQFEKEEHRKTDLVFFNYIDRYLISRIPLFIFNFFNPVKWGALLIHSGTYRIYPEMLEQKSSIAFTDYIFNSKNCVALAIHDEGIAEKLNNRFNAKVCLFPEIADLSPPDLNQEIFKQVKQRAKNRIVIGTIGLEPHKCGYEFLQLAKNADPEKYFFVFAGIFNSYVQASYNRDKQDEFTVFFSQLPENCFASFGHIDEGVNYNTIFCSFDIIFLVYKNFYNASNRLTKAAYFKRLVLSSNLGCIGEDILKYDLGEVVSEINTIEMLAKLELLKARIMRSDFPTQNWILYSEKHHVDNLQNKFKEILELL